MQRENVKSSNLKSVGYDALAEVLEIEFLDGCVYQYFNVSEYVYNSLMGASSLGKYFSQNIENLYKYNKV